MLWEEYCLIRLSVQYRGRAVSLIWRVIRHGSSSVRFEEYQAMLKRAKRLLPAGVLVCFLADRGFAGTTLMGYLQDTLRWHFRTAQNRIKKQLPSLRKHLTNCCRKSTTRGG
jgi:hypothetical protein